MEERESENGDISDDSNDEGSKIYKKAKPNISEPEDIMVVSTESSADDMDLEETIDTKIGVRTECQKDTDEKSHILDGTSEKADTETKNDDIEAVNILESLPLPLGGESIEGQEVSGADLLGKDILDEDTNPDSNEELKPQGKSKKSENSENKKRKEQDEGDNNVKKKQKKEENDNTENDGTKSDKKTSNMRRNIREVMDETQLDEATLAAQRQEAERLKRLQEQQRLMREVRLPSSVQLKITSNVSLTPGNALQRRISENQKLQKELGKGHISQVSANRLSTKNTTSNSTLQQRIRMMTPSVSILPVVPKKEILHKSEELSESDLSDEEPEEIILENESQVEDEDEKTDSLKDSQKAVKKDVVTISSSSESSDDDCIVLSDADEQSENEEDPSNSGMHTNDLYNLPDEDGRVLINLGHPDDEPDVFLAPQVAKIIKPHQIGGIRFLYDNIIESIDRYKTSSGFGCILAHSMGLGKTLQVANFCDIFFRCTGAKTVLCIMPINTLQNWLAEFNMWLPYEDPNKPKETKPIVKEESSTLSDLSHLSSSTSTMGGGESNKVNIDNMPSHQPMDMGNQNMYPHNQPYSYDMGTPYGQQNMSGYNQHMMGPNYPVPNPGGYTQMQSNSNFPRPENAMSHFGSNTYSPYMQNMSHYSVPQNSGMYPGSQNVNPPQIPVYPNYHNHVQNIPQPQYNTQLNNQRETELTPKKEENEMETEQKDTQMKTENIDQEAIKNENNSEVEKKEEAEDSKESVKKTPFSVDAPAGLELRPRHFHLHILNDSHKTMNARAKVIREWQKVGGVLLIGYELYRQLSLKKPKKPKRKRGQPFSEPTPDVEKEDKNKDLLDEMQNALVNPGPDLVICDEGHRIKNSHASISLALKQMRTKRRVVLTGYPLQNNLLEYWCMVDFVRPNYLGTKSEFCNMFERPIQNGQCIDSTPQDIRLMRYRAHVLHDLLEGFVQRRSHSVLQLSLPQKEEYILLVRMTAHQRKLYDTFMNQVVKTRAVPNPLKAFAVCCKIWNHPDVLYHFLKKRQANEEDDLDLEEAMAEKASGEPNKVVTPGMPRPKGRPRGRPAKNDSKRGRKPLKNQKETIGNIPPEPEGDSNSSKIENQNNSPNQDVNKNLNNSPSLPSPVTSNTPNTNPSSFPQSNFQNDQSNYFPNGNSSNEYNNFYNNQNQPNSQAFPSYQQSYNANNNNRYQEQQHPNYIPPNNNISNNSPQNYGASQSNSDQSNNRNHQSGNSYSNVPGNFPQTNYSYQGQNYPSTQNHSGSFPSQSSNTMGLQNFDHFSGTNTNQVYGSRQNDNFSNYSSRVDQNQVSNYPNSQNNQVSNSVPAYPGDHQGTNHASTNSAMGSFSSNQMQANNYQVNMQQNTIQGFSNPPFTPGQNTMQQPQNAYSNDQQMQQTFPRPPYTPSNQQSVGFSQNQTNPISSQNQSTNSYGFKAPQNQQQPASMQSNDQTYNCTDSQTSKNFGTTKISNESPNSQTSSGVKEQDQNWSKNKSSNNSTVSNSSQLQKNAASDTASNSNQQNVQTQNSNKFSNNVQKDSKPKHIYRPAPTTLHDIQTQVLSKTYSSIISAQEVIKDVEEKKKEEMIENEINDDEDEKNLLTTKEETGIPYDWAIELMKDYVPDIVDASAKMSIFFCILEESISLGDRVLTFSQSLFTLNLIEDFLSKRDFKNTKGEMESWQKNINYYRLDGSTSALEREKLINEFNANPKIHLFLVSTRAGSLGINLVGANRAIVFDASWNPCHDTQAVCRVYRYGQKKQCFVYRLVTDNCLEKKIYDRQISKQGMADRVVDQCNPDAHLSLKEAATLSWDWEEDKEVKDFSDCIDSYKDDILRKVLEKYSKILTKEPFHHESLLVDRKDKKLSQAEKRLARRGYELEKMAVTQAKPSYNYIPGNTAARVPTASLQIRAIKGVDNGPATKPVASVRPMQQRGGESISRGVSGSRWIPAEVWQRQGMSAQEMTLPLDVVIPTNSPDKGSIVLKAGQRVMVLKSPKGIYMQLESGKIIAIRTSLKLNQDSQQQKKDDSPKKGTSPPPGQKISKPEISFPLKNNSAISIIPKTTTSNITANRSIVKPNPGGFRPFEDNDVNKKKTVATAAAKPYSATNQISLSRINRPKQDSLTDTSSIGENSNSSDSHRIRSEQNVEEVHVEDLAEEDIVSNHSTCSPASRRSSDTDSSLQKSLDNKIGFSATRPPSQSQTMRIQPERRDTIKVPERPFPQEPKTNAMKICPAPNLNNKTLRIPQQNKSLQQPYQPTNLAASSSTASAPAPMPATPVNKPTGVNVPSNAPSSGVSYNSSPSNYPNHTGGFKPAGSVAYPSAHNASSNNQTRGNLPPVCVGSATPYNNSVTNSSSTYGTSGGTGHVPPRQIPPTNNQVGVNASNLSTTSYSNPTAYTPGSYGSPNIPGRVSEHTPLATNQVGLNGPSSSVGPTSMYNAPTNYHQNQPQIQQPYHQNIPAHQVTQPMTQQKPVKPQPKQPNRKPRETNKNKNVIKNIEKPLPKPTPTFPVSKVHEPTLAPHQNNAAATHLQNQSTIPETMPKNTLGVDQVYPYAQYPRYYDYNDTQSRSVNDSYGSYYSGTPSMPASNTSRAVAEVPVQSTLPKPSIDPLPVNNTSMFSGGRSIPAKPIPQPTAPVKGFEPPSQSLQGNITLPPVREDIPTAFSQPSSTHYSNPYPSVPPYDPYSQTYLPPAANSSAYSAPGYSQYGSQYNSDYSRMYTPFSGTPAATDAYSHRGYGASPAAAPPSSYYSPFSHAPPPYPPNYPFLSPYPNSNVPADQQPPMQ